MSASRDRTSSPWISQELFGRDHELEHVEACLVEGRDVVVSGAAGIGKTSLAIEVLRRLVEANWLAVMIPAARVASIGDIADLILRQIAQATDETFANESLVDRVAGQSRDSDRLLSASFELLARIAAERECRAVVVVDDLDALFSTGQAAAGETFARKMRSASQRSSDLSALFLVRSEAILREVFEDPDAPMFGDTTLVQLSALSPAACEQLIDARIGARERRLTAEAISRTVDACAGMPIWLTLTAETMANLASAEDVFVVDLDVAERALAGARKTSGLAVNERIEAIRRSHRQGLFVARRLAHGESPYAGVRVPNNVTRALKGLERLGLAHQPAPREWALTDPFLIDALCELDPHGIAAGATTLLQAGPMNLPSSERSFRRLRGDQAWGLRLQWFEPATTFRDVVHGDITLTRLERAIVQTSAFQRLRRVRQLGTSYLVYPGATHTRFEHALGVLATSSSLCETVLYGHGSLQRAPAGSHADARSREVMALTRIAGLVHDLASPPYADALKDEMWPLESEGERLTQTWKLVVSELEEAGLSGAEAESLRGGRFLLNLHHACDERFVDDQVEYGFVRDLLRGPLSADSFDRNARDRTALGFGPSSFARLASAMRLVSAAQRPESSTKHVAISLLGDPDIRDQMLHYLELSCQHREQVLEHPRTRAANAMVGSAIARWLNLSADPEEAGDDLTVTLGQRLLRHSEDGLLDHLADFAAGDRHHASANHKREAMAIGHLVDGILKRRLYDRIATARGGVSLAAEFCDAFGDARLRRRLEVEAAAAAGIEGSGHLLVLIPEQPQSILGEILLDDGDRILRVADRDDATAQAIRRLDRRLVDEWAVDVFVDPGVSASQRRIALDWLASHMRLRWETGGDDVAWDSSSELEPAG